jgi:hypothetical protein
MIKKVYHIKTCLVSMGAEALIHHILAAGKKVLHAILTFTISLWLVRKCSSTTALRRLKRLLALEALLLVGVLDFRS